MSGFKKILQIFGEKKVRELISEADKAFRSSGRKIASGDPDLFVYDEQAEERFFIEVKDNDQITGNQRILFPLLQRIFPPPE